MSYLAHNEVKKRGCGMSIMQLIDVMTKLRIVICRRTQCQWNNLLESALDLEDIANNERNTNRSFVRSGGRPQSKFPALGMYSGIL